MCRKLLLASYKWRSLSEGGVADNDISMITDDIKALLDSLQVLPLGGDNGPVDENSSQQAGAGRLEQVSHNECLMRTWFVIRATWKLKLKWQTCGTQEKIVILLTFLRVRRVKSISLRSTRAFVFDSKTLLWRMTSADR